MEAERWRQIEALFQAVQAQLPEKRAGFLAEACPNEPQLRDEVQSLLDQQADSFLESAPISAINALSPGAKFGNFEIVELLGRGGMGEVWRARDSRLRREVAIKVLPAGLARDPDRIARFEREARAASALNHPNIVSVHDIGCDQGTYWIATELVAGEPLVELIKRGPLAARKAIEITAQIADGLAAAHAAGIVHRDLKPANIMLARDGRVKILDFGLAKQRQVGADSTTLDLTGEGTVMGTAGYMSPEQIRGEEVDQRSDLFSFGVILHEMLGGKRAFAGDSSVEMMSAILKRDPPELPTTVPPTLERVVRRCLEKDRDRRFQSAADLGFALGIPASAAAAPAGRRRTWPLWASAAAMCLATAIATYWWASRWRPVGIAAGTTLRRLTTDDGLTTDATLSSDGRLVAYASDRADSSNLDIWVQHVEGGGAIRLTDDPADDYDPSISPDGSQVAFRSERDGGGIYVVPVLGGDARRLIPGGYRPRFSPDGQMLMYSTGGVDVITAVDLFVQRLSGGTPTQIGVGCKAFPFSAVWSPDGSRILFDGLCDGQRSDTNSLPGSVWVSTLDGRRVGRLNLQSYVIDQWLANPSRLILPIYESQLSDGTSIVALPISTDGTKTTGPAERLTFGTGSERHAAAAHGVVALSAYSGVRHIWGMPVDATGHAKVVPRQLTSSAAGERLVYLSRDGAKLLFRSMRADHHQLYCRDLNSGKQKEIPWEGDSLQYAVLSPDANQIVFTSTGGASGIYTVSVSGGIPSRIWGDPETFYGVWDWAPDGSTILFYTHGAVESLDVKSNSLTPFLADPGSEVWQAHFSPDGHWVTFIASKNGGPRVYVAPYRKGPVPRSEWIPVAESGWDDKPHFSSNGKLIFFSSERDGFRCIWAQPLDPDMHLAGAPFAVHHFHERRRSLRNLRIVEFSIEVGPDMVLFNQEERTGNIWLLEPAKKDTQ